MKWIMSFLLFSTLTTQILALELEGVYTMTEREDCAADTIDSIIFYSDESGEQHAAFSSNEYGIVYQHYRISWDGLTLTGTTTSASRDAALLSASVSEDQVSIEGQVDSVQCPGPWRFQAQMEPLYVGTPLEPFDSAPNLATFAGSYSAQTSNTEGVLRLMMIGGELHGNFGNATVPRLLPFAKSNLDVENSALELFSYGEYGALVKWHLTYGMLDNKIALSGYGISTTGRLYEVNATRQ